MGHVFDFQEANDYEQWLNKPENKLAFEMEVQLLRDMLQPVSGESLLDIGCGTGPCLEGFIEMGLKVTGLDPSTYMLDIASKKIGHRADFYRGYAEDLPFDDNSFNHACLFTTLEFVDDYRKALEETFRVAKDRVFIGVLNRYAIIGLERRVRGIFTTTIFNRARFFSVWELKQTIKTILGDVPISWRTVCQLPASANKFVPGIEQSKILQRCPFGAFAGMVVTLVPRFKTRPLTARYQTKQTTGTATG